MSPIWLITRSEYLRRVRSRWFVASTLLTPFLLAALVLLPAILFSCGEGGPAMGERAPSVSVRTVAVLDETGALEWALLARPPAGLRLVPADAPRDSLKLRVWEGVLHGALVIPPGVVSGEASAELLIHRPHSPGPSALSDALETALRQAVYEARLGEAGVSGPVVASAFGAPVGLRLVETGAPEFGARPTGEAEAGTPAPVEPDPLVGSVLGTLLGMLIYGSVLVYGVAVMRGVIEEKTSRVMEVMASSARPFELMMGKVLGIGAVGLTQLFALGAVSLGLAFAAAPLLGVLLSGPAAGLPEADAAALTEMTAEAPAALLAALTPGLALAAAAFFLGGYLLFASLFAAVGSAVDQEADAQALQAPVMIPILIPLLFLPYVAERPEAALSVGLSLFPFSSPVLMVVRMGAGAVPAWQVALSLGLLAAAFVAMTALAARVYRTGMLMYGKKATLRELWRWARTP